VARALYTVNSLEGYITSARHSPNLALYSLLVFTLVYYSKRRMSNDSNYEESQREKIC